MQGMAGVSEELAEPPFKIPKLDLLVEQNSESEPIQAKSKNVAYLRDADLVDLLPIRSNKRLSAEEPQEEGSASPFVLELLKDLEKPLDSRSKEEIRLKELRLYLANEGRSDLARNINSPRDFEKLPLDLRNRFEGKGWYFNTFNDVGGLDDYQLLCLGPRDNDDDPIAGVCNKVGNTLKADVMYKHFCTAVFGKLEWNDTEYVGFQKAIRLKSNPWYYDMKTLTIPWVLNEWTTYRNDERKSVELVELYCKLWDSAVNEGGQFSEMLYELTKSNHDPCIENNFRGVCDYVQQSFKEKPWMKSAYLFIDEYCQQLKPVKHLDKGYLFYVKMKITKAIELGILKKDNEEDFDGVANFLKEIEDGYPDYFDCDNNYIYS